MRKLIEFGGFEGKCYLYYMQKYPVIDVMYFSINEIPI